jgi:hypothetical protein
MAPHDFAAEPVQACCSLQRLVQKSRNSQQNWRIEKKSFFAA